MRKIDIVGHFGSRYSYATVGSRVARALRAADMLGAVINLDDQWIEDHQDLSTQKPELGAHVLLFTDVRKHVFDTWAEKNGPKGVAIFSSPNTTLLSRERAEACARAGLVIVPSLWCADTVTNSLAEYHLLADGQVVSVPLGVDERFVGLRYGDRSERPVEYLHFSTDFTWPSRKGTDELLWAWASVRRFLGEEARLSVHVPMAIYEPVQQVVSELDLVGDVKIILAPDRGTSDDDLVKLYAAADVIVQPSRCEGFGMMMLAAVVSGTPLVTTSGTGQADFLCSMGGWLGIAHGTDMDELAYEDGEAPVVNQKAIEDALLAVSTARVYNHLFRGDDALDSQGPPVPWTWNWATEEWISVLKEWVDGR